MYITADAFSFAAYHQTRLAMRFQPNQPINDMHARVFQRTRPLNVALLIKPRLEFNENGHLFAVFAGAHESVDDRGVRANTVKGLLDGQHGRVRGGRVHKIHHMAKRIIRVVEE